MAQKKHKEEPKEEKFEWVPPDFDEREFLEKDIKATRILLVTALIGTILAIVAALTTPMTALIGAAIILIGAVGLKWFYQFFKIDTKELDKKTWASNIALFLLLSLGLWIVLMNPPFADYVNPEVRNIQVWAQDNTTGVWTLMTPANQATLVKVGSLVNITAYVADNAKLSSVQIKVFKAGDAGSYANMTQSGNRYGYATTFAVTGLYTYQIKATDTSGKVTETAPASYFTVNP
jgi:hypothetical protein